MTRDPQRGHSALRRGRVSLPGQAYHLTVATRKREPSFRDFHAASAVCRCFHNLVLLGDARLLAWVLMPDHAHWLLQLGDVENLSLVVNRLKSTSARAANAALGRSGPLWTPSFHDHALRGDEDLASVARYIVANPLRAGLVTRVGAYPFWNAVWL